MAGRRRGERRWRLAAPSGRRFTLVDRGERGFQLEVSVEGRGRVWESVGRGSREEAARRAVERIAELERPAVAVDSPSLARAGAELIVAKDKAGHAAGYVSAIEGHLRNFILPHYGLDTRLSDVAADEHKRFKHVLGEGDIDLRTCNRVLTTLRQLFVFGEEKGYCGAHAIPKNFREDPQTMVERWRILAPEQIGSLLAHAGDDLSRCLRSLRTRACGSGLRCRPIGRGSTGGNGS